LNAPAAPISVSILDTRISLLTLDEAAQFVENLIASGETHYVCLSNVHTIMTGVQDKQFQEITNNATLALPDGMPLVWAARLLGFDLPGRVYGPDLFLTLCERSVINGYSHFLYGGGQGVPQRIAESLSSRFPGIRIVGCYSPPFRPLTQGEDDQVVKAINESGADILWVGLGAPKQEYWMASHVKRIAVPVMMGVGAAFDFCSGTVKQAPPWMQKRGLEWLFRLSQDPRRLWKRYCCYNPLFVYHATKQIVSQRFLKR
jgi:N-acetylglucosaminyldiphosphoundecaprenol N-acetyl-beta-D-mannosaminyltransferase